MIENYIKLVKKQIKKLDVPDGDFKAWKTSALVVLIRISGKADPKVGALDGIRVDYGSSWSMRTVSGSFDPVTAAKNKGREIMETALDELELFGEDMTQPWRQKRDEALGEIMKVKDFNVLKDVLESGEEEEIVKRKASKLLEKYKLEEIRELAVGLLLKR